MKNLVITFFIFSAFVFTSYAQSEQYNLGSQNLHKKVRKTIQHYYQYDKESGGFVKKSVDIKRYNDDGNLVETYYLFNSKFSDSKATKRMYNYNTKGFLLGTINVSDEISKYSSNYKFTYDRKGNLIKKESIYKNNDAPYTSFKNDKKGREISNIAYSKDGKISSESTTTYKGSRKTNSYTGYSSKDGSITGNYTTIYNDNLKIENISNGKYSNSKTTYNYDKNKNLLKSISVGKEKTFVTNYDYEYDKKDNWVKKHYRSGKYQYFYFREIYFANGDVTGSTNFDTQFINRLGNFDNVAVVPLKKKEKKKNTDTDKTFNIKNRKWDFSHVYLNDKVKKLIGTIGLNIGNYSNLKLNSDATFNIKFKSSSYTFKFKVSDYKKLDDKYQWTFTNSNGESGILYVFKKDKVLKDKETNEDVYISGLLKIVEKTKSTMSFYLK